MRSQDNHYLQEVICILISLFRLRPNRNSSVCLHRAKRKSSNG